MFDRADIGDAQAVGHQGGGPGAPAAGARAAVDDVAHNEEIGRKIHLSDDFQFVFQALHHGFGQVKAVALAGALVGGLAQNRLGRSLLVIVPGRHDQTEVRAGEGQAAGDASGIVHCLGTGFKALGIHFGPGQPGIGRRHLIRSQSVEGGVLVNGPQQAMQPMLFGMEKKTARHRYQGICSRRAVRRRGCVGARGLRGMAA